MKIRKWTIEEISRLDLETLVKEHNDLIDKYNETESKLKKAKNEV